METAKRIVAQLQTRPQPVTEQDMINTLREYLQTITLKHIYRSTHGAALSFMGGTALRMCYNIKRYSEDLDFALDDPKSSYDFAALTQEILRELQWRGFEISSNVHEDKTVQKARLSFSNLATNFGLKSFDKQQKLHIKIEVDTKPVLLQKNERESFFINRFQEIFPILKHTLPTLFAGKVLAILNRPYAKGRDYYDLIWYLSQKAALNLDYLNRGLKNNTFKDRVAVTNALRTKIRATDAQTLLKDVGRFLEDASERQWIEQFDKLFEQLVL